MPRRLHHRPEPGMRDRGQALVCVYSTAAICVTWVLQSMQKHSASVREYPGSNTSQPVGSPETSDPSGRAMLECWYRGSRAGGAGPPFDVVASDGGFGAKCGDGAVGMV